MYLMLAPTSMVSSISSLIYGIAGLPGVRWSRAGLGTSTDLVGPFSLFPSRLSESIRLSPTTLKRFNLLIKAALLDALNWPLIGGTAFAEVAIFSQVLVWLCLTSVPSDCQYQAMNFDKPHVRLPLSISSAMAIIISYEWGQDVNAVKSYSKLGRLTALGFSIFTLIFLSTL